MHLLVNRMNDQCPAADFSLHLVIIPETCSRCMHNTVSAFALWYIYVATAKLGLATERKYEFLTSQLLTPKQ